MFTALQARAPGCRGGPRELDFEKHFSVMEGEIRSITLDPEHATLQVKVAPWGEVFIDGQSVGVTPVGPQTLYAGRHTVEAVGPLNRRVRKEIVLAAGESQMVRLIIDSP